MAATSQGSMQASRASAAPTDYHTIFPSTTLFQTHSHPTTPNALSCSPAHVVTLLTPTLLTFQPLSTLLPPASFPPSTATAASLPSPTAPTTPFAPLTFPLPPHHPPTTPTPPATTTTHRTPTARAARAAQLDVEAAPGQAVRDGFTRGGWCQGVGDVGGGCGLYGVVMARGNAHLVAVEAGATLSTPRSVCELSAALGALYEAEGRAGGGGGASVEGVQARARAVSVTAIGFSCAVPSASISSALTSMLSASCLLVAVGSKDGRVSVFALPLPLSASAVTPVHIGSFTASSEYISELSFAPHAADISSAVAVTPATLHLAVGDTSGVTSIWQLKFGAGDLGARQLHVFKPAIAHTAVSILTWHRTPSARPLTEMHAGGECDSCSEATERCGVEHVILAVAVASSISIHFIQFPSFEQISSFPIPAVHTQPISSLILTSSPSCAVPVLLSSSASSATYRHLLTSAGATHHSHHHRKSLLAPIPARYGLCITPDGLLLLGCDVRMADTRSLKKRDGLHLVSVKAWPVSDLHGGGEANEATMVEANSKKRKRSGASRGALGETDQQRGERWTQQHQLLDEFTTLCEAMTQQRIPRCYFNLRLFLIARLSPLSHLLALALGDPPLITPHASVSHIRFLDALVDWLTTRLSAVISGSVQSTLVQSCLRTLHFLSLFALRSTSGDCQFIGLTIDDKVQVLRFRSQIEAMLGSEHFSALRSSISPAALSNIKVVTKLLVPSFQTSVSDVPSQPALPSVSVPELCAVCDEAVPFTSLRSAQCANGHHWCRDHDTLRLMSCAASYLECAQCEGRAECAGTAAAPDICCWMCGVVRARFIV